MNLKDVKVFKLTTDSAMMIENAYFIIAWL